ncbi:MAG: TrkA family potassium uptake protein [Lachnospiraceae bacterium]|nr:TrkA family potassium uptake protein [Lachnospiraceae bacterium]
MKKRSDRESYAVFGLGEFGKSVALELMESGADVMVIDKNEDRISDISDKVTLAMEVDVTEKRAFENLGLSNFDGVIVAMTGCIEACLVTILAAKEEKVPFILAKAHDSMQAVIFEKVGADKTVTPEHDGGIRVARNLAAGNFLDFFELSGRIRMVEVAVRPEWVGKTLKELDLRKHHRMNVVAIRRRGELTTDIHPDAQLNQDETVMVIIDKKYISDLLG